MAPTLPHDGVTPTPIPEASERAIALASAPAALPGVAGTPALPGAANPAGPSDDEPSRVPGQAAEHDPRFPVEATAPGEPRPGCTAAQLRRFIKSRAWIPMHELRRRFAIDGREDDVMPVEVGGRRVFVGLPGREAQMLGDLFRSGEVGYELSLDPASPIVIGIFPMRPVIRS
jgi:hypothetical protein